MSNAEQLMPRVNAPTDGGVRAAIYARVSTDEQAEHGTSLDEQVRRCEAYCAAQGWHVLTVHREQGVSGTRASRPELDKLMRAARRREVDAIVVAKLDRWGRSMRHLSAALGDLDDLGIRFASVAEAIDSSTASGRLLRNVLGAIAEFEREAIVERTSSGLRAVARGGWWPGGPAPYGYRVERDGNRSSLVIDEEEAAVVRTAVELLVDQRLTTWQAAAELNVLGYRPRRAPRWTYANLRRLLRDAHGLSGNWPYQRRGRSERTPASEIVVEIPPILTPDRHQALRAVLESTSTGPGATARKTSYLLVGRIRSACGASMQGARRRDRGTAVYRCSNDRAYVPERCDCRTCDATVVEGIVWSEVVGVLAQPDRLIALADAGMDLQSAREGTDQALSVLERRIRKLEKGLSSTLTDLVRQGMDAGVISAATVELEGELARLRQHRATVEAWALAERDKSDRLERLWELARHAELVLRDPAPPLRRRILDLLDVRVHITGWEPCGNCSQRGFVTAGFEPGSRSRGATGVVCPACRRHRFVPAIEISGVVPDTPSLDVAQPPAVVHYPFVVNAAG